MIHSTTDYFEANDQLAGGDYSKAEGQMKTEYSKSSTMQYRNCVVQYSILSYLPPRSFPPLLLWAPAIIYKYLSMLDHAVVCYPCVVRVRFSSSPPFGNSTFSSHATKPCKSVSWTTSGRVESENLSFSDLYRFLEGLSSHWDSWKLVDKR